MYRILVIDDVEVFRRKICRLPYFQAHQDKAAVCWSAQNGKEGLEILEQERVDIVITDIRMPIMDGLELLRIIHERGLCRCTILLSEYSEFSYAKAGIIYGAFDYVVKPITNESVAEVLDRAVAWLERTSSDENSWWHWLEEIVDALVTDRWDSGSSLRLLLEDEGLPFQDPFECSRLLRWARKEICSRLLARDPELKPYIQQLSFRESSGALMDPKKAISLFSYDLQQLKGTLDLFQVPGTSELIKNVCRHVLTHIEEPLTLERLSAIFYISKKHLSARFRQETGIRFVEYLTRAKVQRAKALLQEADAKVYLVAERLGYKDTEYFSKVFKAAAGCTPSAYKEQLREIRTKGNESTKISGLPHEGESLI